MSKEQILTLVVFLVALVGGVSSIIASTGELFNKGAKGIRYILPRGWIYLACTVLLMVLPTVQSIIQDNINAAKDIENKKAELIRDSTLKAAYDTSVASIKRNSDASNFAQTLTISQVLSKNNYELDSSNKELRKMIRDSSKKTIVNGPDPTFSVVETEGHRAIEIIKTNEVDYTCIVHVKSADATTTRCQITAYVFIASDSSITDFHYAGTFKDLFNLESGFTKDVPMSVRFELTTANKFDVLLVWLKGTYKNTDGTKTFPINTLYSFNIKNREFGIYRKEFMDRLEQKIGIKD